MKHLPLLLAAAFLPAAAYAAPAGPADRAALEALARSADQAWDARDAEAMSRNYSETASARIAGMADPVSGRDGIRRFFEQGFAGRKGTMRHITTVEDIELPQPDLAVSDGRVVVQAQEADGGWKTVREFTSTSVAVREGAAWKLAAVRAQPVQPVQPAQAEGR